MTSLYDQLLVAHAILNEEVSDGNITHAGIAQRTTLPVATVSGFLSAGAESCAGILWHNQQSPSDPQPSYALVGVANSQKPGLIPGFSQA